jgi:hypothetical protein
MLSMPCSAAEKVALPWDPELFDHLVEHGCASFIIPFLPF